MDLKTAHAQAWQGWQPARLTRQVQVWLDLLGTYWPTWLALVGCTVGGLTLAYAAAAGLPAAGWLIVAGGGAAALGLGAIAVAAIGVGARAIRKAGTRYRRVRKANLRSTLTFAVYGLLMGSLACLTAAGLILSFGPQPAIVVAVGVLVSLAIASFGSALSVRLRDTTACLMGTGQPRTGAGYLEPIRQGLSATARRQACLPADGSGNGYGNVFALSVILERGANDDSAGRFKNLDRLPGLAPVAEVRRRARALVRVAVPALATLVLAALIGFPGADALGRLSRPYFPDPLELFEPRPREPQTPAKEERSATDNDGGASGSSAGGSGDRQAKAGSADGNADGSGRSQAGGQGGGGQDGGGQGGGGQDGGGQDGAGTPPGDAQQGGAQGGDTAGDGSGESQSGQGSGERGSGGQKQAAGGSTSQSPDGTTGSGQSDRDSAGDGGGAAEGAGASGDSGQGQSGQSGSRDDGSPAGSGTDRAEAGSGGQGQGGQGGASERPGEDGSSGAGQSGGTAGQGTTGPDPSGAGGDAAADSSATGSGSAEGPAGADGDPGGERGADGTQSGRRSGQANAATGDGAPRESRAQAPTEAADAGNDGRSVEVEQRGESRTRGTGSEAGPPDPSDLPDLRDRAPPQPSSSDGRTVTVDGQALRFAGDGAPAEVIELTPDFPTKAPKDRSGRNHQPRQVLPSWIDRLMSQ